MNKTNPNDNGPDDDLSPLAIGAMWVARITSLGMEVALMIFVGHWLDGKFGPRPLWTILGALLAMAIFMIQLVEIAKKGEKREK